MEPNISIPNSIEMETYSNDDLFNITSWGADLSFRELVQMYDEGDLLKPELQRKYVWTKKEASRFIDSILLGLPVPSIFLAKHENETKLIVDGYQRIMTIYDFMKGNKFSNESKTFSLLNSEVINSRWRGKSYNELTSEEQRKIRNTTIHAIIFQQKEPQNDTGMYQIFERINTSGAILKPQEIRNCVYQGSFNTFLFELNRNPKWRKLYGTDIEDTRMYDLELILRYFAINDLKNQPDITQKQINLLKYLNNYMGMYRKMDATKMIELKKQFEDMIDQVYKILGKIGFKKYNEIKDNFTGNINPAVYDAISIATTNAINKKILFCQEIDYIDRYKTLMIKQEFIDLTSKRTTDIKNIKERISMASSILYGVDYDWN